MPESWTILLSVVPSSWLLGAPGGGGNPCDEDATICNLTFEATDNNTVARAVDLFVGRPLAVVLLVLGGLLLRWVLHKMIDRVVRRAEEGTPNKRGMSNALAGSSVTRRTDATRRKQRARTMGSLLKSVVTGVLAVVVSIMALSEIGVNVAPLIASAGIIGIALGFGAQSLVSDFLAGSFMIVEDQYGVGDWIDLGDDSNGEVEAVSLRVTRLRDMNGTVWYVRNGEILRVGNMSQNWSRTVLDVPVDYGADLDRVIGVLEEVAHDLWEDDEYGRQVLEEPEVWGVQEFSENCVLVRVALKTGPAEQWAVAREMRRRINKAFYEAGIEIPLPQRVIWQRRPEEPVPGTGDESAQPGIGADQEARSTRP